MTQDKFTATPTLVIGIGGTGLKVTTFVKKNLLEANHNKLPAGLSILALDTEKDIKFKAGGWGQERNQNHATGPVSIEGGEYIPLIGNVKEMGELIKNEQLEAKSNPAAQRGQRHRHMSDWFQAEYYIDQARISDGVWNLSIGAGRFRQFGRLGLFNNIKTVSTMLGGALRAIKQSGKNEVYVHIVGSLAGGTGAALFIDIAFLTRQLAKRVAGFQQAPIIFGHFVLSEGFRGTPQVQISNPGIKADFDARCYAALRELTRLQGTTVATSGGYPLIYDPTSNGEMNAKLKQPLYSATYLYDGQRPRNPVNVHPIEDGLAPGIADALVAYIDDRSGGAFCSHSVNHQSYYPAFNIPTEAVTYGGLGTYTIELPIYHITEGWSHNLALSILDTLLKPDNRDDMEVPTHLSSNQISTETEASQQAVRDWLHRENTFLIGQLSDWGFVARRTTRLRDQMVSEVLSLEAHAWQQHLAPANDNGWRDLINEAQNELTGSLLEKENKYYVNPNQAGKSAEQKADALIQEIESMVNQIIGKRKQSWLREGGAFRRALVRLGHHHIIEFEAALIRWLTEILNGTPGIGSVVERKQGKLGYAQAFIEALSQILQSSREVLSLAMEQSKNERRPVYNALESELKESQAKMQRNSGFRNKNLKEYHHKADEILQFQKADIAREVMADLLDRLEKAVAQIQQELALWEQILATAKAHDGGAYALILSGKREVAIDRTKAANAVRWVIGDNEAGDTYINDKHAEFIANKRAQILNEIQWEIGKAEPQGPLRINFCLAGEKWDRLAGAAKQRQRGLQNVAQLLGQCRTVFNKAWETMSVTAYLKHNYQHRIAELAQKVYKNSGYMLSMASAAGQAPPMRTTFMRVYKDALDTSEYNFLRSLQSEIAKQFKETTNALEQAQERSDTGENSRDRFKLTFVMFGDLLKAEEIQSFINAQQSYHTISGQGEDWKPLHILPAETHALKIERTLSSGPSTHQQRRRELDEAIVTTLEDIERFRLAMRCLAYGETDYDWGTQWGLPGRRGLLLYRYTPRENNPNGLSYWGLTIMPAGEQHPDGLIYTPGLGLAEPEHIQLSEWAADPDLSQAFVQLTCVGRDRKSNAPIDWQRVEKTVRTIMEHHRQHWTKRDMGWTPKNSVSQDSHLLAEAQDKAAQIIRLKALIKQATIELEHPERRWAWEAGSKAINLSFQQQRPIQRTVDLWTAIQGVAQEEIYTLNHRFSELATWQGESPSEKLALASGLAETEIRVALPSDASHDNKDEETTWTCSKGHTNPLDKKFCVQCGQKQKIANPISISPKPTLEGLSLNLGNSDEGKVCVNGHKMFPEAKFCSKCGQRAWHPPTNGHKKEKLCLSGHPMSAEANFCSECGQAAQTEEKTHALSCIKGHPMPAGAKFCPECGKPPRLQETAQIVTCINGHPMPPEAKFCPKCGHTSKALNAIRVVLCPNSHEIPNGANFCPQCGETAW